MPWKTILTVVTFAGLMLLPQVAPALRDFKTFDPQTIPLVWQMPVPKPPPEPVPAMARIVITQHPTEEPLPKSVVDPTRQMDRFYASLLKGGVTRVLHYGDSP